MDDERFRLNKSNYIMIIITIVSLIVLGIVIVLLVNSYSKPIKDLPKLSTTEGRTSTKYLRTTTETTTTTTTTQAVPANSPYYSVDVASYISEELLYKSNLNKEEKQLLVKQFYEFFSSFYSFSDMSIFKTDIVINNVKANENDVISENGHKYAEIYNGNSIMDKYFSSYLKRNIPSLKYDNTPAFIIKDNKFYRIEQLKVIGKPVFDAITVTSSSSNIIDGSIRYYLSDYKEKGYSSPIYETMDMQIRFNEDHWVLYQFKYPLYK